MQAKACQCRSTKHPCTSDCLSENCHNKSPTQTPLHGGGGGVVPYCFKVHNQREPKYLGVPRSRPGPLSCHPPGCISPRFTDVVTQRPCKRSKVALFTILHQNRPHVPISHQDRCPRNHHSISHQEHQNKFK